LARQVASRLAGRLRAGVCPLQAGDYRWPILERVCNWRSRPVSLIMGAIEIPGALMSTDFNWPFETSFKVIFRDLDAMGHVNNAVYFTYMETARTEFFAERFRVKDPKMLPVIVAEASCTYLAPLYMRDLLKVHLGVSRIGRRSFDFAYFMTCDDGRTVARGKTGMVTYDYEQARAIPIPDSLRSLLQSAVVPAGDA
jgi:acyl-CoA thioester hydrolase